MNILDIPMQENDAEAATIKDYLKRLLLDLWQQGEGFSSKRPFGNSGWESDLYYALVAAKVAPGELDEDGCLSWCDSKPADKLISDAIRSI
jgi:hypothetical protein